MRLSPSTKNLISIIKNKKGVLLHGSDQGVLGEILKQIINNMENYDVCEIEYKKISDDGIMPLLSKKTLFQQKIITKITNCPESILSSHKKALNGSFLNFPIFMAYELSTKSTLRKFFEQSDHLASINCYSDNIESVKEIIKNFIYKNNKVISDDALSYLSHNISGNRTLIFSELNKLLCFIEDKRCINYEDVSLIQSNFKVSIDNLCIAFATKDHNKYFSELEKIKDQNISPIYVIRSLIKYYINLYKVKKSINNNTKIETAIKSLTPPILFLYVDAFKKNISNLSFNKIILTLTILKNVEVKIKSTTNSLNILESLFFSIA